MSKKRIGKRNPMWGKTHSKETRTKISQANKGKLIGDKNPMFGKKRSEKMKKILVERRIDSVWMYNDELKLCSQVQKHKVIEYQIDGWIRGRKKY